jgi:hypothetical protein
MSPSIFPKIADYAEQTAWDLSAGPVNLWWQRDSYGGPARSGIGWECEAGSWSVACSLDTPGLAQAFASR